MPPVNVHTVKDGKFYIVWSNEAKNCKISIPIEKAEQITAGVTGIGKSTVR
jgi:excinuclease UvrABC ATPase subunit